MVWCIVIRNHEKKLHLFRERRCILNLGNLVWIDRSFERICLEYIFESSAEESIFFHAQSNLTEAIPDVERAIIALRARSVGLKQWCIIDVALQLFKWWTRVAIVAPDLHGCKLSTEADTLLADALPPLILSGTEPSRQPDINSFFCFFNFLFFFFFFEPSISNGARYLSPFLGQIIINIYEGFFFFFFFACSKEEGRRWKI